jgi:hypothetical protein
MTEKSDYGAVMARGLLVSRIFSSLTLCIGVGIAYFVWPTGALDSALSALTLAALLRATGAIVIAVGAAFVALLLWME